MKESLLIVLLLILAVDFSFSRDPRRGGKPSATPGGDIFLQGNYLEVAVNPSGGFGNRPTTTGLPYGGSSVPVGFHPSPTQTSRLGIVVDYGKDGWNVGNPAQVT